MLMYSMSSQPWLQLMLMQNLYSSLTSIWVFSLDVFFESLRSYQLILASGFITVMLSVVLLSLCSLLCLLRLRFL